MKKLNYLLPTLVLLSFILTGCSNENGNGNNGDDFAAQISAKWEISDTSSPYVSFEFTTDGVYIATERATEEARSSGNSFGRMFAKPNFATRSSNLSPVHIGKYTINESTITLIGFGILEVIEITKEEFSFSFTLQNGGQGTYVASRADEPISSSNRTNLMCRSWKFAKFTIDEKHLSTSDKEFYIEEYGDDWKAEIEQEENEDMQGCEVIFSKAGTYLVLYNDGNAGLSEWKWYDGSETKLYYSWDNWKDEWQDNIVYINELTATKLIFREREEVFEFSRSK